MVLTAPPRDTPESTTTEAHPSSYLVFRLHSTQARGPLGLKAGSVSSPSRRRESEPGQSFLQRQRGRGPRLETKPPPQLPRHPATLYLVGMPAARHPAAVAIPGLVMGSIPRGSCDGVEPTHGLRHGGCQRHGFPRQLSERPAHVHGAAIHRGEKGRRGAALRSVRTCAAMEPELLWQGCH